jgi:hypothetical protein
VDEYGKDDIILALWMSRIYWKQAPQYPSCLGWRQSSLPNLLNEQ